MLDFQEHFEFCERNYLEETFRFNNNLCDFSTKFILQNPNQIQKRIISHKTSDRPAVTLMKGETKAVLEDVLNRLNQRREDGKTVFIIGRYNHLQPKNLDELARMYPKLTIEYSTAHRSKGLEADYVIIIGLTSGEHGFPCQIVDDPVLNLVLAKQDSFPNTEERRLFYVSITRARKHVYLVVDNDFSVSSFISEIQQKGYEIDVVGGRQETVNCPACKTGWIVLRNGQYGEFYSCSNYPYCEYRPKRCPKCRQGFLLKKEAKYQCLDSTCSFEVNPCPFCNDGYLVLRKGKHGRFYGCTNYPKCNYIQGEY
jgi:DNA helicase-4